MVKKDSRPVSSGRLWDSLSLINSSLAGWVEWKGIGLTVQRAGSQSQSLRHGPCDSKEPQLSEGLGLAHASRSGVQEAGASVGFS